MTEAATNAANIAANIAAPGPSAAMPYTAPHLAIWPKRLPRSLVVPQTSLWFNLEVAAARYPDKPAFVFFGQALTYARLKTQAEALAGWLQAQGVGAGDRVALYLEPSVEFAAAVHAVLRADAVVAEAPERVGRACRTFAELPKAAQDYVLRIEALLGVPVPMVSVGPGREQMILR